MSSTEQLPGAIIAIQQGDDVARKVLHVLTLRDGSFSIASPFHPARTAELGKLRLTPLRMAMGGRFGIHEAHRASGVVKLMYHASGFTQFSSYSGGEGWIRSGRHPKRRWLLPKGLAVQATPITEPIETGATLGASFAGIGDCEPLTSNEPSKVLLFREGQFAEPDDHGSGRRHSFDIGFYVLPGRLRAEAFLGSGGWTITMRDPESPDWILDYRVLDLPTSLAFVAVRVVRRHFDPDELSEHAPAYTLTGPRDMVTQQEQLIGAFPAPPHAVDEPTLDLAPSRPRRPRGPESHVTFSDAD